MVEQAAQLHKLDSIIDELEEQAQHYQQFAGVLEKFQVMRQELAELANTQAQNQTKLNASVTKQNDLQQSIQSTQDAMETSRNLQEKEYKSFLETTQTRTTELVAQLKTAIEQHVQEAQVFQETLITQTEEAILAQATSMKDAFAKAIKEQEDRAGEHADTLSKQIARNEAVLQTIQESNSRLVLSIEKSERRVRYWQVGIGAVMCLALTGIMVLVGGA